MAAFRGRAWWLAAPAPGSTKAIRAAGRARQAAAGTSESSTAQSGTRALVEQLATTLQACLLSRFAPAYLSEAFAASRLDGADGHTFGTLPSSIVNAAAVEVIERSFRA